MSAGTNHNGNGNGNRQARERVRDQAFYTFMNQAKAATGFSEERIREILKERWDKFQVENIPEYLKHVRLVAEDIRGKQAMEDLKQKMRNRIKEPVEPETCPACSKGTKISSRTWGWVCSVGDVRCNLAMFLSRRTKHTPQEALEILNLEWDEYNRHVEEGLEVWREELGIEAKTLEQAHPEMARTALEPANEGALRNGVI